MVPQTGPTALSDFFYMSLGGTAQVVQLPKFHYGQHFNLAPPTLIGDLFAVRSSVVAGGPAATIGYVLPWDLGQRPRIELAASALFGRLRNDDVLSPISSFSYHPIGLAIGSSGFVASDIHSELTTTFTSADVGVRLRTDLPLGSALTLTPSIAGVFGFQQVKYDLTQWGLLADPFFAGTRVDEKLTTWRGGAELGVDATFRLGDRLMLHGGLTGAAYYQHTRLVGNDCKAITLGPGGSCVVPAVGVAILSQVRASDSGYGARVGASLGATYSLGWMNLTVMGTGSWTHNVPGIDNPRLFETGTARVGYEDRFSYGGLVMATFPLD